MCSSLVFSIIPSAPSIIGILIVFKCHILVMSIFRLVHFGRFPNSVVIRLVSHFYLKVFFKTVIIIIIISGLLAYIVKLLCRL